MIVEKKLGISPDYQFKAINSKNFLQANWHKNKLTTIKTLFNVNRTTKILDLGPGSGNLEFYFGPICSHITCVDYNDDAIQFLRGKLNELNISNVELFVKDITKLNDLKLTGKYDLITMIDVIEHLHIEDASKLVNEFKSLLSPNGKVLIITPNYKSTWVFIESLLDKVSIVPKFAGEQHLAKFYESNLNEIFEKAGFRNECFKTFNYLSYLFPSKAISKLLCKLELKIPFKKGNLIAAVYTK